MPYNRTVTVQLTPTISTSAYTANDVVGGLLVFDVVQSGGGGVVGQIEIADDHDVKAAFKLYLFNAAPTAIANDAAFAPAIADLKKLVGVVDIGTADYSTINSNAWAQVKDLNIWYSATGGTLYGYLVCDATPDYNAATDLTITLTAWVD
jgi:hypothetical protein